MGGNGGMGQAGESLPGFVECIGLGSDAILFPTDGKGEKTEKDRCHLDEHVGSRATVVPLDGVAQQCVGQPEERAGGTVAKSSFL